MTKNKNQSYNNGLRSISKQNPLASICIFHNVSLNNIKFHARQTSNRLRLNSGSNFDNCFEKIEQS